MQEGRKKKNGMGCAQILFARKKERERRDRRISAEYAETGWECGDDANFVVYATIPARLIIF